MALGDRIKNARKEKGFTQRQLAELINAKHNSISNWENNQNKPDPDTIELLCGVLDISPSWLLSGAEYEKDKNLFRFDTSTNDINKKRLINYYVTLNETGREKLLERAEELTYIPKYCKDTPDYLQPVAAHNDYAEDEEEQRLMQEDLDDL